MAIIAVMKNVLSPNSEARTIHKDVTNALMKLRLFVPWYSASSSDADSGVGGGPTVTEWGTSL